MNRRSLVLGCAVVSALALPVTAGAGVWGNAGGDEGRSGFLPNARGSAPFTPLWDVPDRGVQTSVIVTHPGARGTGVAPRVIYGTSDGRLHLRDLYSGEAIGDPKGIRVGENKDPAVWTGFGGSVTPVETSDAENGLGQIFAVVNDSPPPAPLNEGEDPVQSDKIAIALVQVDELTGRVVARTPLPGTEKMRISSSPVLSPPDGEGTRSIHFTTMNREDYADPKATVEAAPEMFRLTIRKARSTESELDLAGMEAVSLIYGSAYTAGLNPLASPTLLTSGPDDGKARLGVLPYVTLVSQTPDTPLRTLPANNYCGGAPDGCALLFAGDEGPGMGRMDREADSDNADRTKRNYVFPMTPSVPVTPSGKAPGLSGSQSGRAPAIFVATYSPKHDATTVHRLVQKTTTSQDEFGQPVYDTTLQPAGKSQPMPGRPAPQLTTTQNGLAPGESAGLVLVTMGTNLVALDGGDLSVEWKLDPTFALVPGDSGFGATTAAVANGIVHVSRDNGRRLALRLADGKPLAPEEFDPSAQPGTGISSVGAPAVTPSGVVIYASDIGVAAYRNRCGNALIGDDHGDGMPGTFAGDDLIARGGDDSSDLSAGDDCADGGAGDDTIAGGQGLDRISGGVGNDRLLGGDDADTIAGGVGNDRVDAGRGTDSVDGGDGVDVLKGGDGSDQLRGGADDDRMFGDAGNDALDGGAGDDRLTGGFGADRLRGGPGIDKIFGGNGDDVLTSGPGGGVLSGGSGDDQLNSVNGQRDRVNCGSGRDTVRPDRLDILIGCETVLKSRRVAPAAR